MTGKHSADALQTCQIAQRAYAIWESEGKPRGRDMEHWLRAEVEIRRSTNAAPPAVKTSQGKPTPPKRQRERR